MDGKRAKRAVSAVASVVMLTVGVVLFAAAFRQEPAASSAAAAGRGPAHVTILHVNDTHGKLLGLTVGGREVGGAARLATAIRKVRQAHQGDGVLLVHCGDVLSRGDELTQRTAGAANVAVMNSLRYDLWVLGNGEFYGGLDVLRQRMAEAKFPVLSANVTVTGELIAEPYVIKEIGGARIAFFGLSVIREQSERYFGIDEADPIETARQLVPQLRSQADVVIAATHLGLPQDVRLAAAVEGIDLILGAHTHTVLQHGFRAKAPGGREVLICQAGDQYRYLGQVDLTLVPRPDAEGFAVSNVTAKLIPLDEKVPPDPATEALLAKLSRAASQPATASAPAAAETSPVLAPAAP